MIKVILNETIPGQGKTNDIIDVSDGFARNFLLPRGKAVIATPDGIKKVAEEQKILASQEKKLSEKNQILKDQIENLSINIAKKTKDGKLFGSVTAKDIVSALVLKGIKISPKSVTIDKPIKSVGKYVIGIMLDNKYKAGLKVAVLEEK